MQSGRPPGSSGSVRVRDLILLFGLLVPISTAALQQQPHYPSQKYVDELADAASTAVPQQGWRAEAAGSLHAPDHDTDVKAHPEKVRNTRFNQRAISTVSPAESNPAVRALPVHEAAVTTVGLEPRLSARSLQDWQVEDIMLLATVDGELHGRDRRTGAHKWALGVVNLEMVETINHRENKTNDNSGRTHDDPMFIVEPCLDGSIYVISPGYGLQRLGYTVKQLAELAPYASDGFPAVTYTAEKKKTLYTVNAATGKILKTFSSTDSFVTEDTSCRRINPLESVDDEECEQIGTLTIGRTDYSIGINDRDTGEKINTVKYFEWTPNNRDHDLYSQYETTMDQKYVYSKYDGTVFGLDFAHDFQYQHAPSNKPVYQHKFRAPVARVFDVVRPYGDFSSDASLVVLPQPVGPLPHDEDGSFDKVYVDCTVAGNWYALSEAKYPTVTDGAARAKCCGDTLSWESSARLLTPEMRRDQIAGVHLLTPSGKRLETPQIGGRDYLMIAPPPEDTKQHREVERQLPVKTNSDYSLLRIVLTTSILTLLGCYVFYQPSAWKSLRGKLQKAHPNAVPEVMVSNMEVTSPQEQEVEATMVREAEPAQETIIPVSDNDNNDAGHVQFVEPAKEENEAAKTEVEAIDGEEDVEEVGEGKKKKKATRGKRGGRKQKEREQAQAEAKSKKVVPQTKPVSQVPQAAEVISVAASESPEVAGPLQINSLVIHTDRIIGQGSCGTIVFEGSFEGRDVAVKRMLSQYYELALQEVSFLQQSDDHPNVVRYFCQQKDDHFLYIAVELCQASLFEVWEADKAKTNERQQQLQALKLAIQLDMTRTLQQLAAGLCHLHNLRIIHRDIKPQNILVAFPKRTQAAGTTRLVISDFGLGKNLPENVSTLVDPTGNAGTSGWKAPELISQPRDTESKHSQGNSHTGGSDGGSGTVSGVKRAADIFALGCLFFWVLTDGIHPFEDENGWQQLREYNIKRGKKNMDSLGQWSDAYEPMQLITSMLEHQPEHRPTAQAVLNHPYFWPPEKRLAFLCDASDHFEREPRGTFEDGYAGDSYQLQMLEYRAEEVIGSPFDFLTKLDRSFVDTLGKQRKYSGNRLLDLLRALRNKKNHYEDMPEHVKDRVGPLASGYLNYWTRKFPKLLITCYEIVHDANLQDSDRFKVYFALGIP